ncbi:MAG: M67 family metallopeptidase [Anaerolineaceae bacterium]|nr:MAG: M67 family metallopeptidase [Anaerolineaceae bacterium]
MIQIQHVIYQIMLAHVQADYPLEACGFLAGQDQCISHIYAIENILHSPTAFEMHAGQQIQAMLDIEAQGLEMLAVYHSHPAGSERPSETDIAKAYYPELVQLIISLVDRSNPTVRAFSIANKHVEEVKLLLE